MITLRDFVDTFEVDYWELGNRLKITGTKARNLVVGDEVWKKDMLLKAIEEVQAIANRKLNINNLYEWQYKKFKEANNEA